MYIQLNIKIIHLLKRGMAIRALSFIILFFKIFFILLSLLFFLKKRFIICCLKKYTNVTSVGTLPASPRRDVQTHQYLRANGDVFMRVGREAEKRLSLFVVG